MAVRSIHVDDRFLIWALLLSFASIVALVAVGIWMCFFRESYSERKIRLAHSGDPDAQCRLGIYYEKGWAGFETNLVEAASWYRKSAEQGCADAMVYLGDMYETGRGVEKDVASAIDLWSKAAEKGRTDGYG